MAPATTRRHASEPRWQRRKEDRPAEILDAALAEFTARGFALARLDDIARRAGVTKGTIFLYFESKEELFKAVVRKNVLPLIQQAESMVDHHEGSPRELLLQLMRARWETVVKSELSALPKLVFSEAGNFPDLARFYYDEIIARSHAIHERVLRAGIAAGEFREMDVKYVARSIMAPVMVAALWKHSFQLHGWSEIDPERYFEAALDVLMAGIARHDTGGNRA
jgi:AcrR family transcriptional regulator